MSIPKAPWQILETGSVRVVDHNNVTIARFYCDTSTGYQAYNSQLAQTRAMAKLFLEAPETKNALLLTVQALAATVPFIRSVEGVDHELITEALAEGRRLVNETTDITV